MIIKFLVRETGAVVEKMITSYDEAMKFVQKLRRSKKLKLMSFWEMEGWG